MENHEDTKIETVEDLAVLIQRTLPTKEDLQEGLQVVRSELQAVRREVLAHIAGVDDLVTAVKQDTTRVMDHLGLEQRVERLEQFHSVEGQ